MILVLTFPVVKRRAGSFAVGRQKLSGHCYQDLVAQILT